MDMLNNEIVAHNQQLIAGIEQLSDVGSCTVVPSNLGDILDGEVQFDGDEEFSRRTALDTQLTTNQDDIDTLLGGEDLDALAECLHGFLDLIVPV